jgi:hypothetical protein
MVEEFGETTGVQVRAGSNTAVSVTLGSFSTSVDWTHCGNPGEVMMDVSSVGGASQYRIEWDTNSDFSNAGSYMSSSTSATFDVGSGGAWYYVRAQAVSAYDGSGVWSELDSVLVELLMESHFPQDVEGWTSYDNADSLPAHQDCSAFGGSGGCLRFLDWQGGVYGGFVAPTSWTSNADWTEYYGGSISYKLYFDVAPTDVLADLEIVGPSYSLLFQIYSTCYPQTGVWQEFDVHLGTAPTYACEAQPEPTNWYISTTGATATLPQILAVLSDVSGFRIRMEYTTLADDAYLDDVEVRLPGALASCQRIRDHDPSAADGDYSITPDTVAFTVYCHDMEGTPSEYLTLVNTGDTYNYAQHTGGGAWPPPGANVISSYTRISVCPAGEHLRHNVRGLDRQQRRRDMGPVRDCWGLLSMGVFDWPRQHRSDRHSVQGRRRVLSNRLSGSWLGDVQSERPGGRPHGRRLLRVYLSQRVCSLRVS